MTGTWINIATVLFGGALGLLFGARLPERVRQTVVAGLGLFTAVIGVKLFLKTEQEIIVLGSLLIGGVLGEWWQIENRLARLGGWLEKRFAAPKPASSPMQPPASPIPPPLDSPAPNRFIKGFLTASLVFCVGPLTILGSLQDGLTGDYSLLAIKSVLDGFAALAFASTFGISVLFSTLVILVYQGGISLLAAQAEPILLPAMNEIAATGGIMLLGISVSSLLEIKPIRVGNFLPGLVVAPLIVKILSLWR